MTQLLEVTGRTREALSELLDQPRARAIIMISRVSLLYKERAMPDILIRDVDSQTLKKLKSRAKRNGRSLQNEAKRALMQAAGTDREEIKRIISKWQRRFAGRKFDDSVDLIREDRDR